MLSVGGATRVFVAIAPVDLRGSFNRLHELVAQRLQQDPTSGHLFLFTNRRRNRLKALFWDGSGIWICAKRLERGNFSWPNSPTNVITLRGEEFSALVSGMEIRSKKNWYRR